MRTAAALLLAAILASCASYRAPEANCFNFLPSEEGCDFVPLGGPVVE